MPSATVPTADHDPSSDGEGACLEALRQAGVGTQYPNDPAVFHRCFGPSAQIRGAWQDVEAADAAVPAAYGL
jgi:hypothetical protein